DGQLGGACTGGLGQSDPTCGGFSVEVDRSGSPPQWHEVTGAVAVQGGAISSTSVQGSVSAHQVGGDNVTVAVPVDAVSSLGQPDPASRRTLTSLPLGVQVTPPPTATLALQVLGLAGPAVTLAGAVQLSGQDAITRVDPQCGQKTVTASQQLTCY